MIQENSVDIIIPVYNEETILQRSVERLRNYLAANGRSSWRIIVASNGSQDATPRLCAELAGRYPEVSWFHTEHKGRGGVLRKVLRESGAKVCAYVDADLPIALEQLPALVDLLEERNAAVAMPLRRVSLAQKGRPRHRLLLSRVYNALIRAIFPGTRIRDAQVGMKAFDRKAVAPLLDSVESDEFFFDTELLLTAERAGLVIAQVPAECSDMRVGHINLLSTIIEEMAGLLRVRVRFFRDTLRRREARSR